MIKLGNAPICRVEKCEKSESRPLTCYGRVPCSSRVLNHARVAQLEDGTASRKEDMRFFNCPFFAYFYSHPRVTLS